MRGKSVMLLAGLASLAQANELNLYSVNTRFLCLPSDQ